MFPDGQADPKPPNESDGKKGSTVKFSVLDTGIGISQRNLKKLFGRFERVHTDVAGKCRPLPIVI